MKARYILPVLLICALLASCQSLEAPAESVPESSAPVSSEAVSSLADSSIPASSAAISSAGESVAASSLPQSSQEEPPKAEASSAPASSAPPPATKKEEPPQKAESVPPPVLTSTEPTEQADVQKDNVPESKRPMTEAEVDAAIEDAIAYAESIGMEWYDDFSIEKSGYYLPANSTEGNELFRRDLFYEVDHLVEIANEDQYYSGGAIAFKIVKGPIEDEENAWFGYVLY